ncbi:hypothetical protein MGYG_05389 [Paecilomyces variotii No. 5]|uniref:Uncharacterized protein n=1 Tax=Byssochlamys spectabilis (strain No. 5 / NBRC 109023) TaxID=1356009 RepID=V5F7F2_BYSSN|nr:hypothetical protein MGYG_05389 [Paecilomyces variotii No. 5]
MVSRPKTPNRPKVPEKEISSALDSAYKWEDNPSLTVQCKNSNEQHEKRHREISHLAWQIKLIDAAEASAAQNCARNISGEIPSKPQLRSTDEEERMTPPKEGQSRKPVLSVHIPNNANMSGFSQSAVVSASPCSSKAKETRLQKQAARTSKDIDKVLRRQRGRTITSATRDLAEDVHLAIHGHPKMPPTVDHEESGRALVREINNFKDLQLQLRNRDDQPKATGSLRIRRRANTITKRDSQRDSLDTDVITRIICELGIKPPFNGGTKDRQRLLQELQNSIIMDIEIVANEARETFSRKEGYWRYANKRAYNEMVRSNELVNWETGEKPRELEVENSHSEDSTDEAGEENLDMGVEHATGETDTVEQDMNTKQEQDPPNNSTKAHIDARNLVITKSPGMLTLSLAPIKEKPRENATKPEQGQTDKPGISMQQAPNPPVIEPIITHKRRTSKATRRRSSAFHLETLSATRPGDEQIEPNTFEMERAKHEPQSADTRKLQGLETGSEISLPTTIIPRNGSPESSSEKGWYRTQLLDNQCSVKSQCAS